MSAITQTIQGQASGNGSHTPGAIFILHNLPFDPEDDFPGTQPYLPYRIENLAATYISPLEQIILSSLNANGLVRAIYVNFGPMGYYELNPNAKLITRPATFEAQLRDLFRDGIISNPDNNEVVWQKIVTDLSSLMSILPTNSRKIGCLHGAGSGEFTNYRDYIRNAPDHQNFVFVVGKIGNQGIRAYIDDYMRVSSYDLNASHCLSYVITEMEAKWGI